MRLSPCLLIPLLLTACGPDEDALVAISAQRVGVQGRAVALRFQAPPTDPVVCCCAGDRPWYALHEPPPVCDVYEGLGVEDRIFVGSTFAETDCLLESGLLEARTARRKAVSCSTVRCPDAPVVASDTVRSDTVSLGGGTGPEEVTVQVATPALTALAAGDGSYYAGLDRSVHVLKREWDGLSAQRVTLERREDLTALGRCVPEERSRRPGPNRKLELRVERDGTAWK